MPFLACSLCQAAEARKLQKVGSHVWAYAGVSPMDPANSYGANAGVVAGTNGALVIDTLISAKEGRQLLADIRAVTQTPIRWVVNTHYHLDHAWGNCVFAAEGATIIGAEPAPKLLSERGPEALARAQQGGLTKEDMAGTSIAPATVSFMGSMFIDLGGTVVELRSLAHGHCPDNLVVWVSQDKVLFAGDLMFVGCHPFLGEGDIKGWLVDLDAVAAFGAEKIIPGHGHLSIPKDVADMKEYLKAFEENASILAKDRKQEDAPQLAIALKKLLPAQGRDNLDNMIENNLRMKYLPR